MSRTTASLILCALAASSSMAASASRVVNPVSIDDLLSGSSFMPNGGGATFSPDGTQLAYVLCDHKRRAAASRDNVTQFVATKGAAMYSLGCDVWVGFAGRGEQHIISGPQGNNWGPAWSPDGRQVVFVSDRDGAPKLWLWDARSRSIRKVSDENVRNVAGVERPQWLADGKSVLVKLRSPGMTDEELDAFGPVKQTATKSTGASTVVVLTSSAVGDKPLVEQGSEKEGGPAAAATRFVADIAVVSIDSGETRRLVRHVAMSYVALSPDKTLVLYNAWKPGFGFGGAALHGALFVVDVASGQQRVVAPDVYMPDGSAASWSPDGRHIAYISTTSAEQVTNLEVGNSAQGRGDLFVVPAAGGTIKQVTYSQPVVGFDSDRARPLWSANSDIIYGVAGNAVWRATLADLRASPLASNPDVQIRGGLIDKGDQSTVWAPDGALAAVVTRHVTTKNDGIYLALPNGQLRKGLEEAKRYAVDQTALASADGQKLVFQAESASAPEDLWSTTSKFATPVRVTHSRPQLEHYSFGAGRVIDFLSADGHPLRAGLLLPAGYQPGKRYPTIVLVYASEPGSRNINTFGLVNFGQYNYQMLATRGYAVLNPDIPVNVGSPMQDLMKSVIPAVDKVVELGIADPDRLGVTGQSNGGYSTLAVIVQTQRFKAAVMNAGFGDLTGFFGSMIPGSGEGSWHPWLLKLGGGMGVPPWENPQRYLQNSPIYFLDRITTPLIIQAGGEDAAIVPFSDEVFVGLRALHKDVTYLRYDGEAHLLENPANQLDYWHRTLQFWEQHLKPTPVAQGGSGFP